MTSTRWAGGTRATRVTQPAAASEMASSPAVMMAFMVGSPSHEETGRAAGALTQLTCASHGETDPLPGAVRRVARFRQRLRRADRCADPGGADTHRGRRAGAQRTDVVDARPGRGRRGLADRRLDLVPPRAPLRVRHPAHAVQDLALARLLRARH